MCLMCLLPVLVRSTQQPVAGVIKVFDFVSRARMIKVPGMVEVLYLFLRRLDQEPVLELGWVLEWVLEQVREQGLVKVRELERAPE